MEVTDELSRRNSNRNLTERVVPAADPDSGSHPLEHTFHSEYERLKSIEREYKLMLKALAVVVEMVLSISTDKNTLVIDHETLVNGPDLITWSRPELSKIYIQTTR